MIDLLIMVAFFAAYKWHGVYIATGILMGLMTLQIAYLMYRKKPISGMQWAGFGFVMVFGIATLLFHDPRFIQIKPTILYWVIAIGFEVAYRRFGKNLAQVILAQPLQQSQIHISKPEIWKKAHHWCAAFFWFLGLLNLVIMMLYSIDVWIKFKAFGLLIMVFIGSAALLGWLYKNRDVDSTHHA